MRQKDILAVGLVIIVAAIISTIASNAIFNSTEQRQEKAPVVEPIINTFPSAQSGEDYSAIFNANSLNPTQLIKIGTSQNQTPFNSTP